MAAPMREGAAHPANFEYDDNEWDIGIGDLIIDLDADIEKTDEAGGMAARAEPDAQRTALKMKIKRTKPGTKSSEAKHEIVKSNEANGEARAVTPPGTPQPAAVKRGSGAHRRDKTRDKHHHHDLNGVARTPADVPPAAPPATPAMAATDTEPAATAPPATPATPAAPVVATTTPAPPPAPPPPAAPAKPEPDDSRQDSPGQPPLKKLKSEPKETADICVGTSVGTITEPDCMGPCEPGSSVTLEGIVWHEMEGMLVVNVTWRGKTYVGTLLDCTRHDWAPPRLCDSPLEEFDARTPKGRAKRGRGAAPSDLANFTETRSSVHSKLRNGGAKGRRALPSPTPFTPPRPDPKRKRPSETEERPPTPKAKRPAPTSPPPEPTLLECPEPNCSKKYKHLNGLKYHRSHAHGYDSDDKEGSCSEQEETPASPAPVEPPAPPPPPVVAPCPAPGPAPCPAPPPPSDEDKSADKPESEAPSPARPPDEPPPVAPPPPATPPTIATPRVPTPEAPPSPAQFKPHRHDAPVVPAEDELPSLRRLALQVKPRSALMPSEERKSTESPPDESPSKRRRRSPTPGARSPAYSDISDDAAPSDAGPDVPEPDHRPPFPVYHQYYGQPSYLPHQLPPPHTVEKGKDDLNKGDHKGDHKDIKPDGAPPKVVPQHFYPYNYVPNFPYNVDAGPGAVPLEDKNKEVDRSKTTASPLDKSGKQRPHDGKDAGSRPNDTHQILKESIEMKSQMGPYAFQRPPPQHARDDELRRYYMSLEQRRKESGADGKPPGAAAAGAGGGKPPPSAPKPPLKDGKDDKGKDEPKVKQEGQKPTTETQGPPPPPTSQYYLPPYMQPPHYFDPVYRAPLNPMLVGGFGGGWAAVPRYHAPEDLSRPAPKLDYYPGGAPHKIHELQEHAKSPAKTHPPPPRDHQRDPRDAPPGKDASRSPPPQRHVHTHHHTHVGLGYPLYPPPYPAAAVLASTQAVVNSFPTPPK